MRNFFVQSAIATILLAPMGCAGIAGDGGAAAAQGQSGSRDITCTYPVGPDDSAESLIARFGEDARRERLIGREGEEYDGIILWPDDPARRLEVFFADPDLTQPESVLIRRESRWGVAGLPIGSTARQVAERNGGPFVFYGFGWDYGGNIFDFEGGALNDLGGCHPRISIAPEWDNRQIPRSLMGDRAVKSSGADVDLDAITVWETGIYFDLD